MGLDIYFHRTKVAFAGDPDNDDDVRKFCDEIDKNAQETLREKVEKPMAELEQLWNKAHYEQNGEPKVNEWVLADYNRKYFNFVVKVLEPIIAKNYEFRVDKYTSKILPFPELKAELDEEIRMHYEGYDAYFRKVNFIFAYFQNIGKMHNDYFAFADVDDVDDLIDRCERVLKDHRLAHNLLPTRDGFFFGSTDYDDWYFSDVKDCLRQMRKFRKLLTEGYNGYVIFSW